MTVDVSKNVPFYSPDSFFSFVPPHQRFLWEDPQLEFFLLSFVLGMDMCAHNKSISKYNDCSYYY